MDRFEMKYTGEFDSDGSHIILLSFNGKLMGCGDYPELSKLCFDAMRKDDTLKIVQPNGDTRIYTMSEVKAGWLSSYFFSKGQF